jgi:Zn-dependent protease with chaperone function
VLFALIAAGTARLASNFLDKSYSRANEYQADRIAAQVTSPASAEIPLLDLPDSNVGYYSAHPSKKKRISALRTMMPHL